MRGIIWAVSASLLLVACGSSRTRDDGSGGDLPLLDAGLPDDSGTPDGGPADGGNTHVDYPAPHPAPPQVMTSGGPVLSSPRVVPVFFAGDDSTTMSSVTDFLGRIGGSEWWSATTAEYGVGDLTVTSPVQLTESASTAISDDDIQAWLANKLNSDDPAFPAPDGNTIYVLHYPKDVDIRLDSQTRSCQSFGGYHNNIRLDSAHQHALVAYAVLPRCPKYDSRSVLDILTGSESHEIIEAATDPYPQDDPAYALVDDADLGWLFLLGGGETADMCAQFEESFVKYPPDLPYMVQRSWSNESAMAGHDPCVPALPGVVYFNSAPELDDELIIDYGGERVLKSVTIPIGQSRTINMDLFSDGDTGGPWDVQVFDAAELFGGSPTMSFSLDRSSGQNGDQLQLTISVDRAPHGGVGFFMVMSTLGDKRNYWIGAVGN